MDKIAKRSRRREKEREMARVRRCLRVEQLVRERDFARPACRRKPIRGSGELLAGLRSADGKRAFWTVSVGSLGTLVACRRKMPLPPLLAALGAVDTLDGELALSVNDDSVLPWRPESCYEEGDNIVSLARVDSPLYGTVFLVCGSQIEAGPLRVSSRAFDRLCAAARSALNF
jgi:hypothetical protein